MWGLESLAVVEMTVVPSLMMAAFCLVSYDAIKNPEMVLFAYK